ncbi:MAG: hypothetical protein IPH88_16755 [Bacteroidales bacterium]|nr:hypothetical protein [Bacteroidales bacterium]
MVASSPVSASNVTSPNQVVWNWNAVTGATGYKWGTTNVYANATDMGTAISKTETGLTCQTLYTRYVWAYNSCGYSVQPPLHRPPLCCRFALLQRPTLQPLRK